MKLLKEKKKSEKAQDINLMTSDSREDEEVEPQNKDKCVFLDDQIEEQKDMSFYRRLNMEVDNKR